MKSLFMHRLPAELRVLIYRELLRDEKNVLEPQRKSRNDDTPKKKLYPAILGVCKQIYAEASAILYEENEYSYAYPYMCVRNGGNHLYSTDRTARGAFERIKKVQINYINIGDFHGCSRVVQKVMVVVKHVANLGCVMKRLYLQFHLFKKTSRHDAALIARSGSSQRLIKALANLDVKKQITIHLESDLASNCKLFVAFANEIALLKGWALTLEKLTAIPSKDYFSDDEEDEGDADDEAADGEAADYNTDEFPSAIDQSRYTQEEESSEERSEHDSATSETDDDSDSVYLHYKKEHDHWETAYYIWRWTLRPATASTKTDVPTASKYRNRLNGT